MTMKLPKTIRDTNQLDDLLSRPCEAVTEAIRRLSGDIMVLGAGGKMGPTLARMARRACDCSQAKKRVLAVSRFSAPETKDDLEDHGIETIQGDLLDEEFLASLDQVENVVFMAGFKFGSTGNESQAWAMNTHLPALVCQKFAASRIVAFSTGNVYPLAPVDSGGSKETDPVAPVGEYAMSCLGRERIFEHFSRRLGTRIAILRLNYACELRYGVLVDIAERVLRGQAIDLTMGFANVIWQAEANSMAIRALEDVSSPPLVLNIAGPERLRVREVAEEFARQFGCEATFTGSEEGDALLSNAESAYARYGRPVVTSEPMIRWIADWLRRGEPTLSKPTHFSQRDGRF